MNNEVTSNEKELTENIQKDLETILKKYEFEFNTAKTRNNIKQELLTYFDKLRSINLTLVNNNDKEIKTEDFLCERGFRFPDIFIKK